MSINFKDFYSEIEAVLAILGRWVFNGNEGPLDEDDSNLLRFVLALQAGLTVDILPNPTLGLRRYVSWLRQADYLDIMPFGNFVKEVSKLLRLYPEIFESGTKWDRQHFKHAVPSNVTFWGYIAPAYEVLDSFLSEPSSSTLRILLQWVDFTVKVNCRSLNLTSQEVDKYLTEESNMKTWEYPQDVLSDLNQILREWFHGFSWEGFSPKHGPGSVADWAGREIGIAAKYAAFTTDDRLDLLLRSDGIKAPVDTWLPRSVRSTPIGKQWSANWRVSQLILVPKSMTTNRSISKEPAVLQFFQQGVADSIHSWVAKHRVAFSDRRLPLSAIYCRERQDLSAEMARLGSIFGDYATIDLSAASDSVTLELVKALFRGTPLLRGLIATRSDYTVVPEAGLLRLAKFAPMGSAVCFPIESLVFASVCELARRRKRSSTLYRVYGDDMVVPRQYSSLVLDLLEQLHFTVNSQKSFLGGTLYAFREACGGEFFQGYEVTPLRISRGMKFTSFHDGGLNSPNAISAGEFASQIGLINRLYETGFLTTRRLAIAICKQRLSFRNFWNGTLCDDQGGQYGIAVRPGFCDNYHLKTRWDASIQRTTYLAVSSSTTVDTGKLELVKAACHFRGWNGDEVSYHEWLRRSSCYERKLLCPLIQGVYEPLFVTSTDVWPSETRKIEKAWKTMPFPV